MTSYLLDTNHAGALLRDNQKIRSHFEGLRDAELGISIPSVGELWFMIYNSSRPIENRVKLQALLSRLQIVSFGISEAEEFGRIRVELKKQGRPIPQIDIQIAATARIGNFVLVTTDSHFAHVSGLAIEDWTKP
jgi:tRNA(fMet)-specific endonuclease VapC